mmetsp:Transcript_61663/g.165669  ORF Transcript_61663/g.165669 Transcript_61663/m.165669 type:complete len:268 (-) Transcript_61663:641-1444(-)
MHGPDYIERIYTSTLFYLAQVYQHLNRADDSAQFCQQTLNRQLLDAQSLNQESWITNAVQLSGYYLSSWRFADSSACLNAAERVGCCGSALEDEPRAKLIWAWAKLHIARLNRAREFLANSSAPNPADETSDTAQPTVSFDLGRLPPNSEDLKASLAAPRSSWDGRARVCGWRWTYEQACAVSRDALDCLATVRKLLPLDGFCTENVQAIQDATRVYKALCDWVSNVDDACKLLKRRIDLLEPVADQVPFAFIVLDTQRVTETKLLQ